MLAPGTGLHLETVLILPAGEGAPACAEAAPQMTGCLAGSSQGAAPSANTAFRLGGSLPLEHQAPSPREGHILSHLALLATTLKAVPEKLPSAAPLEGKHPGGSSAGLSLGDGAGSFTRVPVQGLWPHQRRTRGGHPCALWWPLLLETLALHQVLVPVAAAAQRPSRAPGPAPRPLGERQTVLSRLRCLHNGDSLILPLLLHEMDGCPLTSVPVAQGSLGTGLGSNSAPRPAEFPSEKPEVPHSRPSL